MTSSSIKDLVNIATSDSAVGEDWGAFLDICQLTDNAGTQGARECVLAISKRLPNKNPNVVLLALALTQGLVKNCHHSVHAEISSRQFTQVLLKVLTSPDTHTIVINKILDLINQCVLAFKHDPTLGYMSDIQSKLIQDGYRFQHQHSIQSKNNPELDEVKKRKEQEDLELAIALSLSEAEHSISKPKPTNVHTSPPPPPPPPPPPQEQQQTNIKFHVRALYDFPGTDRGELAFSAGDVIGITDADYDDWWAGQLRSKTGLVPSNYVARLTDTPFELPTSAQQSQQQPLDTILAPKDLVTNFLTLLSSLNPQTQSPLTNAQIQEQYKKVVDLRPALIAQLTNIRARRDLLLSTNDKLHKSRNAYNALLETAVQSTTTASMGQQYLPPSQPFHPAQQQFGVPQFSHPQDQQYPPQYGHPQ